MNLPPLLPEASAQSTISINNVQTTHTTTASSSITLSNFNASAGGNRTLVVAVVADNKSVNTITYGGKGLKQASGSFHNDYTAFWYLPNPNGTFNVVVNMAGNADVIVGAYAISGVDQANPIPTTATNYTQANNPIQPKPTISITTLYSGSIVLDSAAIFGGSTLSSPACNSEWSIQVSATTVTGASSNTTKATPGTVTCRWTNSATGNGWDDTAIEVKATDTSPASTNIILSSKGTATGFVGAAAGNTVKIYNFNPGSGSNRLLLVSLDASWQNASSIKFGGVALTKAVSSFHNNEAGFWYLKNPSSTSADLVVTMAGSTHLSPLVVGAYALSGVNQTNPIPTTNSTHNTSVGSPSIQITTKYSNSWVFDSPSIFGAAALSSPTCGQQLNSNFQYNSTNKITGASSSTIPKAPGKTTCSWTASVGELYDDVAVEIRSYNPSVGILIPLYNYPTTAQWTNITKSHNGYPSVRMIAIANQDSGNDVINNSDFATGIANLQKNGIIVIGYIHTNYGCLQYACSPNEPTAVSLSTAEQAMANYSNYYHVNGTFIDEMSSNASQDNLTYYGNINSYAKNTLGEMMTVGNPGDEPDQNFASTFDTLNIFETNQSLPSSNYYSSWNSNFNKDLFSVLSWAMPSTQLNSTYYNSTAKHVGYLYFTDNTGCFHNQPVASCWPNNNPWNTTSIYLNSTLGNLTHIYK